ncbi:monoacylglycerol/Diacylglycerol O-acyltransferase [Alligator mississippiensis]|uniref:monoacylglycerol/Diacylglycerol O-acyltransferase n=1 Tax=Alligator mississippiensis TaxID=8496 RepID=UPI0003D08E30|nr:monoacylglycerol/Diacylglycerol O-acyltransferase [Alligator mississippiensis]
MTYINSLSYMSFHFSDMEYLMKYLNYGVTTVVVASILAFCLTPVMVLFCKCFSLLYITIYHRSSKLKTNCSDDFWHDARQTLAYFWDLYARIWYGYELHGLKNIPEGPALLIYYHAAIPSDLMFFLARYFILKRRLCSSVTDHVVHKIPGLKTCLESLKFLHGTREECMNALKNGELVCIAPGGAREALFSDETYKLVWCNRKGFARLAIDAKVPIIPMYTENVREASRMLKERKLIRWLYDTHRVLIVTPYGGLPVKLRTHIGEPIPYDPNITAEELAEKTKTALQNLIQRHQQIPGSMWKALLARFDKPQKDD